MLNKQEVLRAVKEDLANRINLLQLSFDDANEALTSETKSSAGDKHETGRAMAQLEQEKLSGQLANLMQLKEGLSRINATATYQTIQFGSIVKTSNGIFFFSVGMGQIEVNNNNVFTLSITTPLGKQLSGKKAGDEIVFNGKKVEILEVS